MSMGQARDILGVTFDNVTMEEALSRLSAMVEEKTPGYVVTPNAEMVYASGENPELRELISRAALVVPDGVGVTMASRILGRPLRARVPGVDLGYRFAGVCAEKGFRLFLLGAKPGVAEDAAAKLKEVFPGLIIAGTQDGYFSDEAAVVDKIRAARPDAMLVCLGCPRQESFMARNLEALSPIVMLGLGGSIDVYAGCVRRAPKIMQKMGLEWFYRLCREPWRARRMAKLPLFLCAAVGERLRGG